ncbi:phage terminase small subunit [Corynebacterium casei]|uniref:phage terminase small subunit n=1 Tax=Corynebacterium casei TaxID=160386 RepID=UPI003FD330D7
MAGRRRKVGAVRADQRKPTKKLTAPTEAVEVPELPPATEWTSTGAWSRPVLSWWQDIHKSPMASEFAEADLHGLYVAANYLNEALNPRNDAAERLKLGQAWERALKSYGLTPNARENLRWSISQAEQAEHRMKDLRAKKQTTETAEPAPNQAGVNADIIALYEAQG